MSELIFTWKNTNLPKWIVRASIRQYTDRSLLEVLTIHGHHTDCICLMSLARAKTYLSREYATQGFRAKWEVVAS